MKRTKDFIDQIMDYESGELNNKDTLELFSTIVKDKLVYSLQGYYGRMANALIEEGWLDNEGNILIYVE